jgi:hypothetical protein
VPDPDSSAKVLSSKEHLGWSFAILSFSLWRRAKLSPRAGDGSSTRGSPSYRLIVVLRVEASVVQVVLNKGKTINQKIHQMKFAEKYISLSRSLIDTVRGAKASQISIVRY